MKTVGVTEIHGSHTLDILDQHGGGGFRVCLEPLLRRPHVRNSLEDPLIDLRRRDLWGFERIGNDVCKDNQFKANPMVYVISGQIVCMATKGDSEM